MNLKAIYATLLPIRAEVVASVAATTAIEAAAVAALLDAELLRMQARQHRAAETARAHSRSLRTAICSAVNDWELNDWGIAAKVHRRMTARGADKFGLARVPNIETIGQAIAHLRKDSDFDSRPENLRARRLPPGSAPAYSSVSRSTTSGSK